MVESNKALQNLNDALHYKRCALLLYHYNKITDSEFCEFIKKILLDELSNYTSCLIVNDKVVDIKRCNPKYIVFDIEEEIVFWQRYYNKLNGIKNESFESTMRKHLKLLKNEL
jgi:hypothetical protein